MDIKRFTSLTFWAVMAALGVVTANAQVTFVATPSSLTFGPTTPQTVDVSIKTSTNQAAVTTVSCPTGLTCTIVEGGSLLGRATPFTLRTVANSAVGTTAGAIGLSAIGVTTATIPVNFTYPNGGTGGTAALSVSPVALTFSQTGSIPPAAQTISVFSSTGVVPPYTPVLTYISGSGYLSVQPTPGVLTNSNLISVQPVSALLATGSYQATLTLVPSNASIPAVAIPITLNVNTSGSGTLVATPASIVFSYPLGTTFVPSKSFSVSGPAFTATLDNALAAYIANISLSGSGAANSVITISLISPQNIPPGLTGNIILTPVGGGVSTNVPVTFTTGSGGIGAISVLPTTLTFTGVLGTAQPVLTQNLTLSSTDFTQPTQSYTATATSLNNFLSVSPTFGTTASNPTVTVTANLAVITTPGTYTGQVTITPLNGTAIQTIPVTLTVTGSVAITPSPTAVTLNIPSGTNTLQQSTVNLTSTSTSVAFTATATTTTGGSWLGVQQSSTILPATLTLSINPVGLAVGTYQGNIALTTNGVVSTNIPVTVTITQAGTLQVAPATLSFNYQTTGTAPPTPQTLTVSTAGAQGLAYAANATTTSGGNWLLVSPTSGTTPATLTITAVPGSLPAGIYQGSVIISSISATNSPQTIPVTLNVTTPSIPIISSFVNAASFGPAQAVPGLIFTVFGRDMGPATLTPGRVNGSQLLTNISGTRVLFDGIEAPIIYTSATQLAAVVPYAIAGRFNTRMTVEYNGQASTPVDLRVGDTAPALFSVTASGVGQGAALNQNTTVNSPNNPEAKGRVLVLYATGEGQTNPQGSTGRIIGSDLRSPVAPVSVRIGGRPAVVEYAGSAPGLVSGTLQVNVRIPLDAPSGSAVSLELQVGQATSQAGITVAIQ